MSGPRIGSLCAGYGGLEEGVRQVLGGTVAWQSEIDPGACKILAHRYPGVPNIGDMTEVDWTSVEPVDVLCGGTPCQDLSHAGKRAGMTEGTRSNLWVSMREAIEVLRPSLVVWENVRGAYSAAADSELESREGRLGVRSDGPVLRALGRVLGDLSELGFDAEWVGLRASDVGAPHGRYRVFVVARPAGDAQGERVEGQRPRGVEVARAHAGAGVSVGSGAVVAADADDAAHDGERARTGLGVGGKDAPDAHGRRREVVAELHRHSAPSATDRSSRGGHADGCPGAVAADPFGGGCDGWPHESVGGPLVGTTAAGDCSGAGAWGPYRPVVERWERLTRQAPPPTEPGRSGPRLSARAVEWMMGLPAGWVTDVPGLSRNDMLKALGNGVVSQQCAAALRILLADAGIGVAA